MFHRAFRLNPDSPRPYVPLYALPFTRAAATTDRMMKPLLVNLTDDDRSSVETLAKSWDCTMSEVIRLAIRAAVIKSKRRKRHPRF